MTCEKCGKRLAVGDFPFCPHEAATTSIIADEVPGGFWAENGFDAPRKFYSKSEHRGALAREGLEMRVKWAGPHDKHVSRWDAVSADQLAKATELVSRRKFKDVVKAEDQFPVPIEKTDAGPVRLEDLQ